MVFTICAAIAREHPQPRSVMNVHHESGKAQAKGGRAHPGPGRRASPSMMSPASSERRSGTARRRRRPKGALDPDEGAGGGRNRRRGAEPARPRQNRWRRRRWALGFAARVSARRRGPPRAAANVSTRAQRRAARHGSRTRNQRAKAIVHDGGGGEGGRGAAVSHCRLRRRRPGAVRIRNRP